MRSTIQSISINASVAVALGCGVVAAVNAAETDTQPENAVITVPLSDAVPQMDGAIGTNEWFGPVVQDFCKIKKGILDPRGGSFSVASDGTSVYIVVESPVHPRYGPVMRYLNTHGRVDADEIVHDDSIEIWFVPGTSDDAEFAYRAMFNTLKIYALEKFEVDRRDFVSTGWNFGGNLSYGSTVRDARWTLEVAIPLSKLGVRALSEGLRMRICRNYKVPFVMTRDNIGSGYNNDPSNMMQVRLKEGVPLVDEPDWVSVKGGQGMVTLRNPTPNAIKLRVNGTAVELAAGATRDVPIAIQTGEKKARHAEVLVTTEDGIVIHRRTVRWLETDKVVWEEVL
jgi:hypothetical protein